MNNNSSSYNITHNAHRSGTKSKHSYAIKINKIETHERQECVVMEQDNELYTHIDTYLVNEHHNAQS